MLIYVVVKSIDHILRAFEDEQAAEAHAAGARLSTTDSVEVVSVELEFAQLPISDGPTERPPTGD